ncbi:helix-turn-helix domain-containing protein [Brevundimonas sp. SORGH_AS_0993]|uniref:helix-turn-helix domain-containing protein n=1 Tax=Brevundimonas sp. SORGH_AS_0993 TaxID=3041794 RepID=UPI0027864D8E|nr:helix-turn-helix domain-containing protein [Brevundimonas sp. SORGH_AS_0993]MDQ1155189.1 HTH-type transcriptional regulator/antitoxin HipB [Brevundimonas sp. SORGH_AS_0993]
MEPLARSPRQLGNLIQRQRKARGLSQSELADLAGTRQEMVSKIESGAPGSRIASICDLLAALDLEMTLTPRTRSSTADIADIF